MVDQPGDLLTQLCKGADQLVIAAPYMKARTLSTVLGDVSPTVCLTCITRWSAEDIIVGVSDLDCRTIVKELGGTFNIHPSLHAKYYRIDNVVLVGSANLTQSAMGWSSEPNLEILCRAGSDFDACEFERSLLKGSREVGDAEFELWQAMAGLDLGHVGIARDNRPLANNWIPATRDPRNLLVFYRGDASEIASTDEQRASRRDTQLLQMPAGLTDEQIRIWTSSYLLAAPFTNTVMQLHGMEPPSAARSLAETYGLSVTDARRDMESVLNWLRFLAPELLRGSP